MAATWSSVCSNCGSLTWLRAGESIEATVLRTTQFGVIVEIGDGIEGVIHVSELSESADSDLQTPLPNGVRIPARVLRIDLQRQKVGLSYRRID